MTDPFRVFKEDERNSRKPANVRVETFYEEVKKFLPGVPQFLLCILPERKNSDLYGSFLFTYLFVSNFLGIE